MMNEEYKEIFKAIYDILNDGELARSLVSFYATMLKEFEKQGFSRQEGISILSTMNFGSTK